VLFFPSINIKLAACQALYQCVDKGTVFSENRLMGYGGNFPDLGEARVMGILNITPDSFYDGGKYPAEARWLAQTGKMIGEGASMIDIGGMSTRPGAREISAGEEWDRLLPAIRSIRRSFPEICISVDTYRSLTAEKAIGEGADMINDISGGTFDPKMPALIGKHNIPFVIMHIQGIPETMQERPEYGDIVNDIHSFFERQIRLFRKAGAGKLIIDPGFGFGKSLEDNYILLQQVSRFKEQGLPLMAGLSRKSMINRVLGTTAAEALNGTTVLNTIALLKGADILRVHDVREAMEAIRLVNMLKGKNPDIHLK
jgi:dihydropteroate synthase